MSCYFISTSGIGAFYCHMIISYKPTFSGKAFSRSVLVEAHMNYSMIFHFTA